MTAAAGPQARAMTNAEPSAPERAATAIRELVVRGTYRSGDRLPAERELAYSLGVGRPGLREAIKRLIESGLLESRHGSGIYVAAVDSGHLFAVRQVLEPFVARLSAENRSEEQAAELIDLAETLTHRLADPEAFESVDADVHALLAVSSGNPILAAILGRLADLAAVSRSRTVPTTAAREATLRDIGSLSRAVLNRDPAAAEASMRRHIDTMREIWEQER